MAITLKIKVTKKEIEKGECGNPIRCAIALAVIDIFPLGAVGGTHIFPFSQQGNEEAQICLPKEAREFIERFDQAVDRSRLPELEFEVFIPDEVINKINIEELRLLLVNHPTLELA